jgi:uncharacterized membrane protein YkvA (DUF1232 family)
MKQAKPTLASYINYASDEGLNLDRFVEHGGRMLGPADAAGLTSGLGDLREKVSAMRGEHPQLARQLELLISYFETNPWNPPEKVRNETIFALLYAAKDTDLMPDDMPEVGYLDDIAVTESVLMRHAGTFERFCAAKGMNWAELKPSPVS